MVSSDLILVLFNPRAGNPGAKEGARRRLERDPRVHLVITESEADLQSRARAAAEEGYRRVLVAGGDGSVHAAVNGLLKGAVEGSASSSHPRAAETGRPPPTGGSPVTLGIVPLGTGNDTARSLAIPLDPEAAVEVLLSDGAPVALLDLIEADLTDGPVFGINTLTGGNAVRVLEETEPEAKARWGAWAYLRTALSIAGDLEVHRGRICVDGGAWVDVELVNLHVGNGRTSTGGIPSAPDADPADGLLDLVLVAPAPLPALLGSAAKHFLGFGEDDPRLMVRRIREVRFYFEPPLRCRVDGEPIRTPKAVRVRSRALEVNVGRDFGQ